MTAGMSKSVYFLRYLFLLLRTRSATCSSFQAISSQSEIAQDVGWEFTDGLEGWASATRTEMKVSTLSHHPSGELRMSFASSAGGGGKQRPHFDSPWLDIPIRERQTVAMRYRYVGDGTRGKVRLRLGSSDDDGVLVDHGFADWGSEDGSDENGNFLNVLFPVVGGGRWEVTYAHIDKVGDGRTMKVEREGNVTQMRIYPVTSDTPASAQLGHAFHVDWIRLLRGPVIHRVTGCSGEQYDFGPKFDNPYPRVNMVSSLASTFLTQRRTFWDRTGNDTYARVYNCWREGGERISIEGLNFGAGIRTLARVFIDGEACRFVSHDEDVTQERVTCVTPPQQIEGRAEVGAGQGLFVGVTLQNGDLPGLSDTVEYLQYAVPLPHPEDFKISNIAAR